MASLMSGSSRIAEGTWLKARGVLCGPEMIRPDPVQKLFHPPFAVTAVVSSTETDPSCLCFDCASAVRLPTNRRFGCLLAELAPCVPSESGDPFISL